MDAAVGTIAGSAWAAGVNLYGVVVLLNLFGRAGALEVPEVLTRTDVLVVAAVLYAIEFVADKVPYLDNVWDAVHTAIRPLGAAALGLILAGEATTLQQVGAAAGSGALALASHTTKATARAAVNTSPEPVSNIVVSLFEDGLVAGVVALAVWSPVIAVVAVVVLVVAGALLVAALWRTARRAVSAVRGRLRPQSRPGTW